MPADAFEVRSVPLPVDGNQREVWKLSIALLCLKHCRSNSATIEQLGVLTWAVRDEDSASEFRTAWQNRANLEVLRAWDDTTRRTLKIGMASNLIQWTRTSRVKLTESGEALASKIITDHEAFVQEIAFLASFKNFSTSAMWSHLGEISPAQKLLFKDSK